MSLEVSLLTVFIAALITALTTGLGVIPWLSPAGLTIGGWRVLLGMVSGLVLVVLADRWLDCHDIPGCQRLAGCQCPQGTADRRRDHRAFLC